VVSAEEGHVFHNRLTHSLQVAQVGRRIAERLTGLPEYPSILALGVQIDPDVVEAACLAHDLGHPPFGHIAEKELDSLAVEHGLPDGFEGNAQSFRIVTRLAMGSVPVNGLNLTRATLNAILKYPWRRGQNPGNLDKWGAYDSDKEYFAWARKLGPPNMARSFEAELMDWADDVTYSVHDLDDFFRAGVIPLDRLVLDVTERKRFLDEVLERRAGKFPPGADEIYLRGAFDSLISDLPVREPYSPTRAQRNRIRTVTSTWIRDFVTCVALNLNRGTPEIFVPIRRRAEIFILKELTWHYVIKNPALVSQQHGQRMIIRGLFSAFFEEAVSKRPNRDVFPVSVSVLPALPAKGKNKKELARLLIDFISSLTEEQAISTYHRISGIALGSSLAQAVR
jgi:dGTPase